MLPSGGTHVLAVVPQTRNKYLHHPQHRRQPGDAISLETFIKDRDPWIAPFAQTYPACGSCRRPRKQVSGKGGAISRRTK